mmetsp:Transcript_82919/g.231230  ORF Transcript_82919/g.231230 Transcript_82919/m.231230 type:complete len:229 (-) Transcript_82919:34-720(-)
MCVCACAYLKKLLVSVSDSRSKMAGECAWRRASEIAPHLLVHADCEEQTLVSVAQLEEPSIVGPVRQGVPRLDPDVLLGAMLQLNRRALNHYVPEPDLVWVRALIGIRVLERDHLRAVAQVADAQNEGVEVGTRQGELAVGLRFAGVNLVVRPLQLDLARVSQILLPDRIHADRLDTRLEDDDWDTLRHEGGRYQSREHLDTLHRCRPIQRESKDWKMDGNERRSVAS